MSTPRNELDRSRIDTEVPLSPNDFYFLALTRLEKAGFPLDQVKNLCLYLPQIMTDAYQAQRPDCIEVLLVCSPKMINPNAPVGVFADGPDNTLNIRLRPTIREIDINSEPIKLPNPQRSGEHLTIDAIMKNVHPDFKTTNESLELGSLENSKKGVLLIGVYQDEEGTKGNITWMEAPKDYQNRYFNASRALDQNGNPVEQFKATALSEPSTFPAIKPESPEQAKPARNFETVLAPFPKDIYEGVYQALRPRGFSPEFVKEKLRPREAVAIYKTEAGETKLPFPILVVSPNDTRSQQDFAVFLEESNVQLSAGVKKFWILFPELPQPDGTQAKIFLDNKDYYIAGSFFAVYNARDFTHPAIIPQTHVNIENIISGTDNSGRLHIPLIAVSQEKPGKPRELVLTSIQIKSDWLDELKRSLASKEPAKQPKPKPAPMPIQGQVFPPKLAPPSRIHQAASPWLVTPNEQALRTASQQELRQLQEAQAEKTRTIMDWLKKPNLVPSGVHRYRLDLPRYKLLENGEQGKVDLASCISLQGQGELTIAIIPGKNGKKLEAKVGDRLIHTCDLSEGHPPTRELIEFLYLLKTGVLEKNMPPKVNLGKKRDSTPSDAHLTPEERLPRMRQAFAKVQVAPPRPKPASPVKPLSRAEFEELKREHGWK